MAEDTDDRLRLLIERVERLEEEKKGLSDDIRDVYNETGWIGRSLQRSQRGPSCGEVRVVRAIGAAWDPFDGKLVKQLIFDQWPGCAYPARAFRKVTPKAGEPRSLDRQFLRALLRLGRKCS